MIMIRSFFSRWFSLALLSVAVTVSQGVQAEDEEALVFSTAPTHSPEKTVQLYTPLVNYLSEVSGQKIAIEPARNYLEYTNNMREGEYDIVFDGPHFVGWRMEMLGHAPLVRLPGAIRIVVVVPESSSVTDIKKLSGKKVCSFASPNMLTMAFLQQFDNPVRQPVMLSVKGFKGLVECLKAGKAEAAVLRDKHWEKMDQAGFKLLYAPERSYPERTISITDEVDEELHEKLTTALLSEEGLAKAAGLLETFKRKNFVAASEDDYDGVGELLDPIWGFQLER